jgi:hypothetical protein
VVESGSLLRSYRRQLLSRVRIPPSPFQHGGGHRAAAVEGINPLDDQVFLPYLCTLEEPLPDQARR